MVRHGGGRFVWFHTGIEYHAATTHLWHFDGDPSSHSFASGNCVGMFCLDDGPSSGIGDALLRDNRCMAQGLFAVASTSWIRLLPLSRSCCRHWNCPNSHAYHSYLVHGSRVFQTTRWPGLGHFPLVANPLGVVRSRQFARHGTLCLIQSTVAN